MRVTQVGRVDGGGGEGIKLCELPLTLWVSPHYGLPGRLINVAINGGDPSRTESRQGGLSLNARLWGHFRFHA